MSTAYDQLVAPIGEELAAVIEFDQRLAEATAEHSALSKRYSADVLKKTAVRRRHRRARFELREGTAAPRSSRGLRRPRA